MSLWKVKEKVTQSGTLCTYVTLNLPPWGDCLQTWLQYTSSIIKSLQEKDLPFTHRRMHRPPHRCLHTCIHEHTHNRDTYTCTCVSALCLCCMCVHVYTHTLWTHADKQIYTHMQILSHIHAHAHSRHIETQIFKCTQIYTERFIRTCTSTYTNGCFHLAEVPCTHQRPRLNTSRRGTLIWNIGESSATNQYCHTGCDECEAWMSVPFAPFGLHFQRPQKEGGREQGRCVPLNHGGSRCAHGFLMKDLQAREPLHGILLWVGCRQNGREGCSDVLFVF